MSSPPPPQQDDGVRLVTNGETHPRSRIPFALFIEDIGAHLEAHRVGVEAVLAALQNMHSKYKFMESNLVENRKQLQARHPELLANLGVVRMLVGKSLAGGGSGEAFPTYFALADQVHAKALVEPSGRVCLWLGADIMLEYSYAEALELLQANAAAAEKKLAETEEDCDFVREQIITIEVNMARVFNHDVEVQRRHKQTMGREGEVKGVSAS